MQPSEECKSKESPLKNATPTNLSPSQISIARDSASMVPFSQMYTAQSSKKSMENKIYPTSSKILRR